VWNVSGAGLVVGTFAIFGPGGGLVDGDFVIYGAGGGLVDEDFVIYGAGGGLADRTFMEESPLRVLNRLLYRFPIIVLDFR